MLISRKRCKIEIYLQWNANKKLYMAYQMAAAAVTLVTEPITLQVIHRLHAFSNAIRRTFVQHFIRFQLTVCSRGPSALAEPRV